MYEGKSWKQSPSQKWKEGGFSGEKLFISLLFLLTMSMQKNEKDFARKLTSVLSFRKGGNPNIRKVTSLLNRRF